MGARSTIGQKPIHSEGGMATLEVLPLLVIFVMLMSYSLGMFGIIHSGILHSIAARTYAFETIRNRTNVMYFRENYSGLSMPIHYKNVGARYHAVRSPDPTAGEMFEATTQPIAIGREVKSLESRADDHRTKIFALERRNERVSVSPAWIQVGYGICVDADCGE